MRKLDKCTLTSRYSLPRHTISQPTNLDVLYGLRVFWQSPRSCKFVKPNYATLIRARSVVQVHPGPPFKSPVNTRRFSFSPFRGSLSKNRFVNRLSTSRFTGWHYTQGVKTVRVEPERLAPIRLCRERCPVTSKDVECSARHCKTAQGGEVIFSEFAGA
jgi:hypothetical protein